MSSSEIEKLEDEVVLLRERVRQLEVACGLNQLAACCASCGLTAGQAAVVLAIWKCGPIHRDALYDVAYGTQLDPREINTIVVQIFKARGRLEPLGIEIKNRHGVGYYMPEESRARFEALLNSDANREAA